jgi:hypothetical protein
MNQYFEAGAKKVKFDRSSANAGIHPIRISLKPEPV